MRKILIIAVLLLSTHFVSNAQQITLHCDYKFTFPSNNTSWDFWCDFGDSGEYFTINHIEWTITSNSGWTYSCTSYNNNHSTPWNYDPTWVKTPVFRLTHSEFPLRVTARIYEIVYNGYTGVPNVYIRGISAYFSDIKSAKGWTPDPASWPEVVIF